MLERDIRELNCQRLGCQDFIKFSANHEIIPDRSQQRGTFGIHDGAHDTVPYYGQTEATALLNDAILETFYPMDSYSVG